MDSNLLFVPYRKTQKIEFGAVLRDIISKEFYQTASAFEADLQEVDTLRNDIIDLGVTPHDLALLKRYYIHLSTFETKFPNDVAEFPWYGTLGYRATGPVKIKSFMFEKINLVYNIAALYTQMGVEQDRSSDECLKKACLYFQYAATHFGLIHKLAQEDPELTLPLDLQQGTIETLRFLCLAQAQEVFWQKASMDKVKDSLVARLALQVSDYYAKALQSSTRSEGFRSEWINHMTVKKFHFEAAAHYRASLVSVSASKYGEEVGHLQAAQKCISNATTHLKFVSQAVKQDFEGLTQTVTETLRTAEKDNDLIYLQDVPSISDLPPIVKAPVTKDMPVDELLAPFDALNTNNYGKQLFQDLLPFYVIQVSHAYRERQQEYVQKHIVTPVRALTKIMHQFLFEKGLPASVDVVDKPIALPSTLLEHQRDVRAKGGLENLKKTFADIKALSVDGERLLQGAKERLQIEAEEDETLRNRQGSQHWTRPTSKEAAKEFYDKIQELEGYLEKAKHGDEVVEEHIGQIEKPLKVLGSDEATLREHIPNSKAKKLLDPSLSRVIAELREALKKSRRFELEREEFVSVVEVKAEQFNILPKIISEYKSIQRTSKATKVDESTFEPVFSKHIKNFSSDLDFIEKQKRLQQTWERQVEDLNKKFLHLNTAQGSNSDREKVLKNLDAVYNVFTDLLENMSQGLKFYNDLNTQCQDLIQRIDKFIYERRLEARDLEMELNSRFQKLQIQSPKKVSSVPTEIERPQSPALVAPKAKKATKPNPGLWQPGSDIQFG